MYKITLFTYGDYKISTGEFKKTVLDPLLSVMEQEKQIKGNFPPDESGFWYTSLCSAALTAISHNVDSLPDKAVEILMQDTKMSEPGNRKEAYHGLAFNYKKISDSNKEKVFTILQDGLKNETNFEVLSDISCSLSSWVYPTLKLEDKINYYYPLLGKYSQNARNAAVEGLLEHCGIDGVRTLTKALNSGNEKTYISAAWGFAYQLKHFKKSMDKNQLKMALKEANSIFVNIVQRSELESGANYFNEELTWALNALRENGDTSAIPVLLVLQKKVQEKFNEEGLRKEYVQTNLPMEEQYLVIQILLQ